MPDLFAPFVVGVTCTPECDSGLMNEGRLRGVCVGYVTRERSRVKQFFTRRAIILGGPALANDATNEEAEALMNAVRQRLMIYDSGLAVFNAPIYIETRNFNDYSPWKEAFKAAGFAYKKHLNFHVDCRDVKQMWERLSDNRKRQVRKAQNTDHFIDRVQNTDIIEWYGILEKLYRTKVKTPLWPVEFFLEAHRQGVGTFVLVKHNDHVIGGAMVVNDANGTAYEWFECGLNGEYKEQYPSVMATWGGIRWAHQNGCARYDMMGAGEPGVPYGVRDFKSEFGGTMVEHGRFLCVSKPWLYKIGAMGVRILKG